MNVYIFTTLFCLFSIFNIFETKIMSDVNQYELVVKNVFVIYYILGQLENLRYFGC